MNVKNLSFGAVLLSVANVVSAGTNPPIRLGESVGSAISAVVRPILDIGPSGGTLAMLGIAAACLYVGIRIVRRKQQD